MFLATVQARGELREAAERVAAGWRAVGAMVVIDRTRFLTDDASVAFRVPDLPEGLCTTIVLLGARGLGFHISQGEGHEVNAHSRISSEAGALSIERCGQAAIRRLVVTSDSGRGAVETVVARSDKPLPALQTILPERTGGGAGALAEVGPVPAMPSPERRASVAEARSILDGASVAPRQTWHTGAEGVGRGEEMLRPGCHALRFFANDARAGQSYRRGKLDLDAELRDQSDGRLLARDHSDAPDAQLQLCVGETTQAGLLFAGSPANAPVIESHVWWPVPQALPPVWGTSAQAKMAAVLLAHHVHSLPERALALAQGGSGLTPVPLSIEPGGCYLAVVAVVQGDARGIGLRVHVGARDSSDNRGIEESSAVSGFCAGDQSVALATVEARGAPLLGWGLALFKLDAGIWGVPQ